jgi:hypothetical protein
LDATFPLKDGPQSAKRHPFVLEEARQTERQDGHQVVVKSLQHLDKAHILYSVECIDNENNGNPVNTHARAQSNEMLSLMTAKIVATQTYLIKSIK